MVFFTSNVDAAFDARGIEVGNGVFHGILVSCLV